MKSCLRNNADFKVPVVERTIWQHVIGEWKTDVLKAQKYACYVKRKRMHINVQLIVLISIAHKVLANRLANRKKNIYVISLSPRYVKLSTIQFVVNNCWGSVVANEHELDAS